MNSDAAGQVCAPVAFDLSSPSEADEELGQVPMAKLRRDLRRAWLERDLEAIAEVLRELAPRHEYRPDELARGLQMTSRHLRRIFAVALGRAPREWLHQRRLLAASELLVTGRSIKDAAYSLGFCSPSQFSRDFRSHFGVTPSMFLHGQLQSTRPHEGDARGAAARHPRA